MTTTLNGTSLFTVPSSLGAFRMQRSTATMLGFSPEVDERVEEELELLDGLLTSRIVDGKDHRKKLASWAALKLTPRRHGPVAEEQPWAPDTLGIVLWAQEENDDDSTVAEVLDADPTLAQLRYHVDDELSRRWHELDFSQRTVLSHRGLRDLLIARAALTKGITTVPPAISFILTSSQGVVDCLDYALVSAARNWVEDRSIEVADIDDDDGATVEALRQGRLSITKSSFATMVEEIIEGRIENADYDALIALAGIDWLTPSQRERLYDKIEQSPVTVDENNAIHLLPHYAAQIASTPYSDSDTPGSSDDPFQVEFFVEDSAQLAVSTAAVKCASQLYYVMTLGDELGVFDAVRYFTRQHLFADGFAVEDRVLRRDLEDYVFNEQFTGFDEEAGERRVMGVTSDAERRAFYRQVFDVGGSRLPEEAAANQDFGRLWKILMLESARYLERAQMSPNPGTYVSKQNVMQAVEDLQYNLSTACVGMATVMTPLMYSELDFVVKRIFSHTEVRRHLLPSGGSWWKVVERLGAAQGQRGRASVLHNKARLGYSIIRAIADYTPSQFEQESVFAKFISDVDAFITTQSILQEESPDRLLEENDDTGYGEGPFPGMPAIPGMGGLPGMPGVPASSGPGSLGSQGSMGSPGSPGGQGAGADDWNF